MAFIVYSTASPKQAFPKEPTANLKQTFSYSAPYSYSKVGLPSATYNKPEAGLSMYSTHTYNLMWAYPVQPTANQQEGNWMLELW